MRKCEMGRNTIKGTCGIDEVTKNQLVLVCVVVCLLD